jgi:hypothetical protein
MVETFDACNRTNEASNPASRNYDPTSVWYDQTADSSTPYFLGPHTPQVLSAKDIHDRLSAEIEAQGRETQGVEGLPGMCLNDRGVTEETGERFIADRVRSSREIATTLETRQNGAAPQTHWETVPHQRIDALLNSDANSAQVSQLGEQWIKVGNNLSHHQGAVNSAIENSRSSWRGLAGETAREHLALIGQWIATTAEGTWLSGQQQEIHGQILDETQRKMAGNPPVNFSATEANKQLQQITDPTEFSRQFQRNTELYHQQKAAHEQAVKLVTDFENTVSNNAIAPAFPTPPSIASTSSPQEGSAKSETRGMPPSRPSIKDSKETLPMEEKPAAHGLTAPDPLSNPAAHTP